MSQPAPDSPSPDWSTIAASPEFQALLTRKRRFLIPGIIFFLVYYLALLILAGWFKDLMDMKIWGQLNIAYVFALSQFLMAWIVAAIYVKEAGAWDKESARIIAQYAPQHS